MAYILSNKCAKNLCKRTVPLQLIIKNVVTCFFWNTVQIDGWLKTLCGFTWTSLRTLSDSPMCDQLCTVISSFCSRYVIILRRSTTTTTTAAATTTTTTTTTEMMRTVTTRLEAAAEIVRNFSLFSNVYMYQKQNSNFLGQARRKILVKPGRCSMVQGISPGNFFQVLNFKDNCSPIRLD